MERIKIEMKNCYGIESLVYEFDFSNSKVFSIYAPNGTMKTSFLKSFIDFKNGEQPRDVIYDIPGELKIFENSGKFEHDIFPVESINLKFNSGDACSSLLVNGTLREQYKNLVKDLEKSKTSLIIELNKFSAVKKDDLIYTILKDFGKLNISFEEFLIDKRDEFKANEGFGDVKYGKIFGDSKVEALLEDPELSEKISEYEEEMERILKEYKYYKEGGFTPKQALLLLGAIKDSKLMEVDNNGVILKKVPYLNYQDLKDEVDKSITAITVNKRLKEVKDKIIEGTKAQQDFSELISSKSELIQELKEKDKLKIKLWKSYLFELQSKIDDYLEIYKDSLEERKNILEQAKLEASEWKRVVDLFTDRFEVPFCLGVEKEKEAILGISGVPIIQYKYEIKSNPGKYKDFHKEKLLGLEVLSGGEKRALYLLDILFEIERRKNDGKKHLIIMDDIADSFDYQNKYTIIEYLKEISESNNLYFIILTHNFDFYRTVQSRLNLDSSRGENLGIYTENNEIKLKNYGDFISAIPNLIQKIQINKSSFITCISLARELIKYQSGTEDDDYKTLTKVLHLKSDVILTSYIEAIVGVMFNKQVSFGGSSNIHDFIIGECKILISKASSLDIEEKITLSIGIRLLAEKLMQSKTQNKYFSGNQTRKLFIEVFNYLSDDEKKILNKVLIATPESIHLNSFMYEPLIDMGDKVLINLFNSLPQ